MASGTAWWVAAACVLAACGDALAGRDVTWPGCSISGHIYMPLIPKEVIEPGQTDPHVTAIHLTECNFTTVNLDNLKNYPNVYTIELKDIKATNITAHTFELLTHLQVLIMVNTAIVGKNLPSTLFRNCHRLSYINFENNDLRDTPADLLQGLNNMKTLHLNNCSLQEIPLFFTSQPFPHMDYFTASDNKITEIGPSSFANAGNLTTLSLSHNSVEYLHVDSMKPLTKIKTIHLYSNMIKDIPEGLFQYKPSLHYVDLSYNQIEIIPFNAFLGTGLEILFLNDNRLMYLPQNFMSNLRTTGVSLDTFHFHRNPWDCVQLDELLVAVKSHKINYLRSEYDGRHPSCKVRNWGCLFNCNV